MARKELQIHCPDCGERIRIDAKTGDIIAHGKGEKPTDLIEAKRLAESRKEKRKDAFFDALKAEKGRSSELDDLFKKASEEAKDLDGNKPDNPMEDQWR